MDDQLYFQGFNYLESELVGLLGRFTNVINLQEIETAKKNFNDD